MHIKGADDPVRARRLVAISLDDGLVGRAEASLVGRRWEIAALDAIVDLKRSVTAAVSRTWSAPPGIGKSRVARESAALAADRGLDVLRAFCESRCSRRPVRCG